MLKKLLKIFSNPIVYYVDKDGNSVFRSYCFLKQTGCLYNTTIPKPNAGKTIEYRLDIDKKLKRVYFLTPIILYFIFIHLGFSIINIVLFELLWILIVNGARIYASYNFSQHLIKTFGKYKSTEFNPPINNKKYNEFIQVFLSKTIAIFIFICLFFIPAPIIKWSIKYNLVKKHNYKSAIAISNFYFSLYPKNEKVYDMTAYAKYKQRDTEGALNDYLKALDLSGKKFTKKDITRLANILYLKKLTSTSNEAITLFNEYSTKKNMSTLETTQILWIKSIFKIENNINDTITLEYDEMLDSLKEKDIKNRFYISSDKAYILYLMKDYSNAINAYNAAISIASTNEKEFANDIGILYAERGFAKRQLNDIEGADSDFLKSKIKPWDMAQYEPYYSTQEFLVEKF